MDGGIWHDWSLRGRISDQGASLKTSIFSDVSRVFQDCFNLVTTENGTVILLWLLRVERALMKKWQSKDYVYTALPLQTLCTPTARPIPLWTCGEAAELIKDLRVLAWVWFVANLLFSWWPWMMSRAPTYTHACNLCNFFFLCWGVEIPRASPSVAHMAICHWEVMK